MSVELEKLAEAINKRWPEDWKVGGCDRRDVLMVTGYKSPQWRVWFNPRQCDLTNAAFIVWGIERLSELGMTPCISVHAVGYTLAYGAMPDVYLAGGKQFEDYPEGCFERRSYTAKTLAECCAQALLAALAASPAQAPGPSNTETQAPSATSHQTEEGEE